MSELLPTHIESTEEFCSVEKRAFVHAEINHARNEMYEKRRQGAASSEFSCTAHVESSTIEREVYDRIKAMTIMCKSHLSTNLFEQNDLWFDCISDFEKRMNEKLSEGLSQEGKNLSIRDFKVFHYMLGSGPLNFYPIDLYEQDNDLSHLSEPGMIEEAFRQYANDVLGVPYIDQIAQLVALQSEAISRIVV